MKNEGRKSIPQRITFAVDEETENLISELSQKQEVSVSEIIRKAIRFYSSLEKFLGGGQSWKSLEYYLKLLAEGEHVIIDIDRLIILLELIYGSYLEEDYRELCKNIAKSHAEQFQGLNPVEVLERLEACNLFKLTKNTKGEYLLLTHHEVMKNFIKDLISELFTSMKINYELKEDITKLRLKIN
ncbi:MAG: ribbon-helix-helix protein, CopG family [Candidatus Freyarchaeum deiterrae]